MLKNALERLSIEMHTYKPCISFASIDDGYSVEAIQFHKNISTTSITYYYKCTINMNSPMSLDAEILEIMKPVLNSCNITDNQMKLHFIIAINIQGVKNE